MFHYSSSFLALKISPNLLDLGPKNLSKGRSILSKLLKSKNLPGIKYDSKNTIMVSTTIEMDGIVCVDFIGAIYSLWTKTFSRIQDFLQIRRCKEVNLRDTEDITILISNKKATELTFRVFHVDDVDENMEAFMETSII